MKIIFTCIIILLFSFHGTTQEENDSLQTLGEVTIKAFEQNKREALSTFSVKQIQVNNGDRYNKTSLVNGFNTIAGVRMEERSPGSYRINIRGSSLRSPFGVRNVKLYWNDIPVTDPGGNTYFNQFAWNNFSFIELFKGPAGSLYGAGTGGLILLHNARKQAGIQLEYVTGSYGLQNIFASTSFGVKENYHQFTYAHNQTNGYRVQTNMRKDNFSWSSSIKASDKHQLTASFLFNDMYYETPGALTLTEYTSNPAAARPAAGGFPSAVNAKAAIYQKNILAGFTNQYAVITQLKNTTTLYGAFAQIKNPAIRNYERRNEPSFGGRTFFTFTNNQQLKKQGDKTSTFQLVGGSEFQQGHFNTQVSKNKNGNPDTLQSNDDINYTTYHFFTQADLHLPDDWIINGGLSFNKTKVVFTRLNRYPVLQQKRRYQNEIAPRISILKLFSENVSLKATASRGFSPPTISELLPSTGVISTELEAEYGWNYEMTATYNLFKKKLRLEATGFYFNLKNALVQRRDISGADFFVNAGDIDQSGVELSADYFYTAKSKLVNYLFIKSAFTYNHFRYGSYIKGSDDFSGKTIPSVPATTFSLLTDLFLKNGIYLNNTLYSASAIFLNDANSAKADAYTLVGSRVGFKKTLKGNYRVNLYFGVDNLLNEKYSLGNDINAAANRFYNAAPLRNYYAGVSWQWNKALK